MSREIPSKTLGDQIASASQTRRIGQAWILWIVFAVVMGTHAWLTFKLFPSWQALVNDEPIISVDHAIHLYHGYLGAKFLKEHGTSWGYDPFFMAGYPKTPVYDSSSSPAELFQLMAGGGYSPRAYKIGILILVGLVPVVVGLAGRAYGSSTATVAATVAWVAWYWWAGFPDILVRTGLVAFVWSSAVAVLVPALLVRWGRQGNVGNWVLLSLSAAVGIQAHSIFPLMVFAPLALGYVCVAASGPDESARYQRTWRWHAATWGAVAMALGATSFWWWPLLQFLPLKTASDLFMTYQGDPRAPLWQRVGNLLATYYLLNDGSIPLLLVLFGSVGLVVAWRSGRRLEATMLAGQLCLLSMLMFLGSEWSVTRHLEPLRFQIPLGLAWCVAAGEGACAILRSLDPRVLIAAGRGRLRWVGAAVSLVIAGLLTIPSSWWWATPFHPDRCPPSTWRHTAVLVTSHRPLAVGLRPEMEELVAWIQANTDNSARILFEDQLRLLENRNPGQPESLHWTPLLPLLTGREFVGGLYHMAFIPHQRAAFGDWMLAGRNIREWTPNELRAFCEQYNIGWVITWSRTSMLKQDKDRGMPLSTDIFMSMPFSEPIAKIRRHTTKPDENEYTIFRIDREASYFAKGRGRVLAVDYNRIELANVEPEVGEVVLRYHWQEGFRSEPPLPLDRVSVPGDSVGFIRIKTAEPLERLVILNGY